MGGASGGCTSKRSGVRRRGNGRCGGGFGDGGGASAAAKTSGLGHDEKIPEEVLEKARREATLKPKLRRNLGAA